MKDFFNMTTDLFNIDPTPKKRASHRAEVVALKKKYGIWTHHAEGCGWLAFSVPMALSLLKGYPLTDEEKAEPMALFMGYCRLIDEAHLSVDGAETELEACREVARRLK